jgi:molecular chaperone IbpA
MNPNLDPFWRSSVGFERILDLMDESLRFQQENNYPPYNILRSGENSYRISLIAVTARSAGDRQAS